MTGIGNVLQRNFAVEKVNKVWAADFTIIPTREGRLYLAVVLDLASRRVVGWSMRTDADEILTSEALAMAIGQRKPKRGLLHHSDRGTQYCSTYYLDQLEKASITPSLSRPGNCLDNAVVESFFHTLKVEQIHRRPQYRTTEEARRDLFDYMEVWYNRRRRHSTLGYRSPAEYEATL
jgi:transposase InsO family protein